MKKSLALVLALLMLVFAFAAASCDNNNQQKTSGKKTEAQTKTTEEAKTTEIPEEVPDLPADLDFKDQTLNILVWKIAARTGVTDNDDFYDADDADKEGEAVYEAALTRQRTIEDKYGVTFNIEVVTDNLASKYITAFKAGLANWDLIAPMINDLPSLIENESVLELSNLKYLDMTKTYWDKALYDSLAIDGKHYVLSGDISTMDEELNVCVAYNKTLGDECEIDPYTLIAENKWTIENMQMLARKVTKDLDGSGKMDLADRYGFAHHPGSSFIMLQGSGELYAKLNADGVPEITVNSSRAVEVVEKLYALYNDKEAAGLAEVSGCVYPSWSDLNQAMVDGKIAFRPANIYNLKQYLLMEDEFTVLPVPMLEENQESGYHHVVLTNSCCGYCVPSNCEKTDFVSAMLEELAYYGRKFITPAYYDSYVNARLTTNEKTAEMFDIIFSTKLWDIGYVFNWGNMNAAISVSVTSGNFASNYDSIKSSAEEALKKSYDAIHEAIN